MNNYKPVDINSPEFKRWFNNSIVVSKNKTPKICYHGTDANFDTFDTNNSYIGSHFGTYKQANERILQHFKSQKGSNIIPVYLKIEHPVYLKDEGNFDIRTIITQLFGKKIITYGFVYEFLTKYYGSKNKSEYFKKLKDILIKKGYDGICYSNKYEGKGYSYIIFHPNQVKSAISNTGEFNSESDNILENKKSLLIFLKESKIEKYNEPNLNEIFYAMILTLYLLKNIDYSKKSLKFPRFEHIFLSSTDLSNIISILREEYHLPINSIKQFLRGNISDIFFRQFILTLQNALKIKNTELINIRREIEIAENKNKIANYLYQFFRKFNHKYDILALLQKYLDT